MIIVSIDRFTVGKTEVTVEIGGCVDCGVKESPGCENAVEHMFKIGDRKRSIMLKRCASCAEKRGAKWPTALAPNSK